MTFDPSTFERDGFVVLPAFLAGARLESAINDLGRQFPTVDDFHDHGDDGRFDRYRDEFGGIERFPFATASLGLLAVDDRLIDLATALLRSPELRVYSVEAWAKFTDAASYEQSHHRDYLNHSLLVPVPHRPPDAIEMFIYLCDVPAELGPPAFVSRSYTDDLGAPPNWYGRDDGDDDAQHPGWISPRGRPDLYDREVLATGPRGTVVAYGIETFHRATEVTAPRGARFTLHVAFRRADAEWIGRRAWVDGANTADWQTFVASATPRQLELFGFPPANHPFWTTTTRRDIARRYAGYRA